MKSVSLRNILLIIFISTLVSCGKSKKQVSLKVLRYRIQSNPPTLDPAHSVDTTSNIIIRQMFEALLKLNPRTLAIEPCIARRFEISPDGLRYTFYLEKNVRFHNGRLLTSSDVKYSFERILNPNTRSERTWVLDAIKGAKSFMKTPSGKGVSGIEIIDTYTVAIKLEKPFAPFLPLIAMVNAAIVPREEADKGDDYFLQHPVGTGPFKFAERKEGVKVVIEKFRDYHGIPAKTDKVIFRVIPDISLAWESYKRGEIDILNDIPPGQIKKIKKDFPRDFHSWAIIGTNYIGINMNNPVLGKTRLIRQALNYAINKKELINLIEEGEGVIPRGVLPPGMIPGLSGEPVYEYNIDKAKQLMKEAGYPDGKGLPEFTLWYNTRRRYTRMCQYLQSEWAKIGVKVKLKNLDWPSYIQACEAGDPELFRMGWMADIPDPDNFLYILLYSKQAGAPGNFTRYSEPAFDELVNQARFITNVSERNEMYKEAEGLVISDAPWVFLYHYKEMLLAKPYLKGLILPVQGHSSMPLEIIDKL